MGYFITAVDKAAGVVRIINVTETVTTIAVPLVATLTRDWLVDSVELGLHFALMNLNTMEKLVMSIKRIGPKE